MATLSGRPATLRALKSSNIKNESRYHKVQNRSLLVKSVAASSVSIPSSDSNRLQIMSPPIPGIDDKKNQVGNLLDRLFPKEGEESIFDKMRDPFGKEKAERERERQKKIKELTGGGRTPISVVESRAQNKP
jgi:hypothetical protein